MAKEIIELHFAADAGIGSNADYYLLPTHYEIRKGWRYIYNVTAEWDTRLGRQDITATDEPGKLEVGDIAGTAPGQIVRILTIEPYAP